MFSRIVLASNNRGKLAELQADARAARPAAGAQGELGIPEAEEPFRTFLENALAKARTPRSTAACPRWPTTPACASMPSAACRVSTPRTTPRSSAIPRATTTT
jgi:hypothetical protein